jgi:outer membrane protein assembly factor BamB
VYASTTTYFGTQLLTALEAATGAQRWTYNFGGIHGVHPPATASGRVYLTTSGHGDSYLYAFDASNGNRVFRRSYANQWSRYYAPVVIGGAVYMAGGYYDGMYRFNATTGDSVWFAATNQYNEWTPAVRNGLVYAYTGSYSPKVLVVNAGTGTTAYEIPDPDFSWNGWSMYTAPVLGSRDNLLATQAGRLVSFDLGGRRIAWQRRASYTGTVAVAGGVAYVINGGELEAVSEVDGSVQWFWRPPAGSPMGSPLVTENLLFVSTAAKVYAIDLASRRTVWAHAASGHLAMSGQGTLFVAQADGRVAAIALR